MPLEKKYHKSFQKRLLMILIDSGPLYALYNPDDCHHKQALKKFKKYQNREWVSSEAVITEVMYFLNTNSNKQLSLNTAISEGMLSIFEVNNSIRKRIGNILKKYRDLPADYADATLVAYAIENGAYDVFSIDKDFSIYRGASRKAFKNLFL